MNQSIAENFMRSANAPVISAGVMMAKVNWKVMKTDFGNAAGEAVGRAKGHPGEEELSEAADEALHRVAAIGGEGKRIADDHPEDRSRDR